MHSAIIQCLETLAVPKSWKVTKYLSPTEIVKVTRRQFNGSFPKSKLEFLITVGRPNSAERQFIKACKKAGEQFPIKKVQIKYLPKKKNK